MKNVTVSAIAGVMALSMGLSTFAQAQAQSIGSEVGQIQAQQLAAVDSAFLKLAALATQQVGYSKLFAEAEETKGGYEIMERRASQAAGYTFTFGAFSASLSLFAHIAGQTPIAARLNQLPKTMNWATLAFSAAFVAASGTEMYGAKRVVISKGQMKDAETKQAALQGIINIQKEVVIKMSEGIGAKWNKEEKVLDFRGIPALPANLQNIIGATGGTISMLDLNKLVTARVAQNLE